MSLLMTSSTMGGSPSRLLNKGPAYLRSQRTNGTLFAHRRRSAVELLEASKPQHLRGSPYPHHHGSSDDISSLQAAITKQPVQSKSEHNLSRVLQDWRDEARDELGMIKSITNSLSSPEKRVINTSDKTNEKHYFSPGKKKNSFKEADNAVLDTLSTQYCNEANKPQKHSHQNNSSSDLSSHHQTSTDECFMQNSGVFLVHRSHSAINCRHARNSSDSSDYNSHHSRSSADFERFFSQMGLEKNVLDPMLQQQEAQKKNDLFESISSLDSPDTLSICSDYAKSDSRLSDIPTDNEKCVTPTSAVERNARIIKWLCSVKKAKSNYKC